MSSTEPTGLSLGYARVSTTRQVLDQQLDALTTACVDADRIWTEKMSGKRDDRPQLAALLNYARAGDTLVVWRLDRLGRSLSHIVRTVADLTERGIHVRSITDGADSTTSTGRLMIGILGSLAEYERELINERAAVAREARAARGKPIGRPGVLTEDQVRHLRSLRGAGESVATLQTTFGVSRATVYRALASD